MLESDLHTKARELEEQSAAIRSELDALYAQISTDDDDSFMARMAERFRDERDQARREVAALKSQLASEDSRSEASYNALQQRFLYARTVIAEIINAPLKPRDEVQSRLLLVHEKIRDLNV